VLDLPQGNDLNIAVASHVMGYTLDYEFAELLGAPHVAALRDIYDEWGMLPDFSRDWNGIKLIAERLRERHFVLIVTMSADGYGATFRRDWETGAISPGLHATVYREDLAHAVCLAALEVVGVKELTV
jgi:hypothetical protein